MTCFAHSVSTVLNHADHIKVRLQVQTTMGSSSSLYYRNFAHAYKRVLQEEGAAVLIGRGMFASLSREFFYSGIRMGLYDPCKAFFSQGHSDDTSFITKFLAGATSGAIGAYVANPCDLIKIRQQGVLPGQTAPYKSFLNGLSVIFKRDGMAGLYKGVSATVFRGIVITASQLSSYDQAKSWLVKEYHFHDDYRAHLLYVSPSSSSSVYHCIVPVLFLVL